MKYPRAQIEIAQRSPSCVGVSLSDYGVFQGDMFIVHPGMESELATALEESRRYLPISRKNQLDYLEGLVVCVNYADYLRIALQYNAHYFDHLVVVTSHGDYETRQVCREFGVECVLSKRFSMNGAVFNKGAAMNDGWAVLDKSSWVLIFDADIVFPSDFRKRLNANTLNTFCVHGQKRIVALDPREVHALVYLTDRSEIDLLVDKDYVIGIGYSQLFHRDSNRIRLDRGIYPENYLTAAVCDTEFLDHWPDFQRRELDDLYCVHIGPTGINWNGRVTESIDWFFKENIELIS